MIAADGDAGRVNLRVTGIGQGGAFFVGAPNRGGVATLGVGRKIKNVTVTAGGEHNRVGSVGGKLPGDQVAHNDAARMAVDGNEVEHFGARIHFDFALADLPGQSLVSAEQQLLAG